MSVNITSPVGRIVMGNLYKANDKDADGNPLVVKSGPNIGKPRIQYFFALAIPKNPGETHWAQTSWGAKIWEVGNKAFPNIAQSPTFAWKIEDGDSSIPNKKGRKACDTEGFAGNWVIKFSTSFAPKIYRKEGSGFVQEVTPDYVKPGYYVEVNFTVDGNDSQQQPGVYVNPNLVCFTAYGEEIITGPDVNACGFGQSPLPAGASAVPLATSVLPGAPAVTHTPAPVTVVPNLAFGSVPVAPPPAPVVSKMTPAANGVTYEAYKAAGWNDQQLIDAGLMIP